jgi:hypothetical protein
MTEAESDLINESNKVNGPCGWGGIGVVTNKQESK